MWGRVHNKVLYEEAPPWGPTPYPFIYFLFNRKGTPFVYLLLTTGTTFTYLLQNPFNCFKSTVFWIWINHKTRTSSLLSPRSNKMHLRALFGLFTDRHDWFPYPFTYFNQWNPHSLIAGDKMSPQTHLGQRYSMNCIARFFPESVLILGMPVLCQLICMVCGRKRPWCWV